MSFSRTSLLSRLIVLLTISQLLLLQAMAFDAGLHKLLHGDADQASHQCIVTVVAHGGCDIAQPEIGPVQTGRRVPLREVPPPLRDPVPRIHHLGGAMVGTTPGAP